VYISTHRIDAILSIILITTIISATILTRYYSMNIMTTMSVGYYDTLAPSNFDFPSWPPTHSLKSSGNLSKFKTVVIV